jgi:hypothetical protein
LPIVPWSWLPLALERLAGIEPGEVLQALGAARRWPRQAVAPDTGVRALIIWSRTRTGRPLKVAVRPLDGREWEIVAVQELSPDELTELEAWEENHG